MEEKKVITCSINVKEIEDRFDDLEIKIYSLWKLYSELKESTLKKMVDLIWDDVKELKKLMVKP